MNIEGGGPPLEKHKIFWKYSGLSQSYLFTTRTWGKKHILHTFLRQWRKQTKKNNRTFLSQGRKVHGLRNQDLGFPRNDGDAIGAAHEELRGDERPDVDGYLDAVLVQRLGLLRALHHWQDHEPKDLEKPPTPTSEEAGYQTRRGTTGTKTLGVDRHLRRSGKWGGMRLGIRASRVRPSSLPDRNVRANA